jgi:hypothetical protein
VQKFWKIAGIVVLVALLGTAAVAAVAVAQETQEGATWPFDFGQRLREAIAGALGITVEKYDAAVETAQKQVLDEAVAEGWLTQEQADEMGQRMDQGPGRRGMWPGFGPGKRGMGPHMGFGIGGREDSLIEVAADELGMTVEDLMTELRNDKSIADVAKEKGVDTQVIIDAYLAKLTENLNQAVTDGKITQETADSMLVQAKQDLPNELSNAWPEGMRGGFKDGFRMGGKEDSLITVAADKLGMTVQDLMTELRDGKSIADAAKDKGVDTQVISDAYLAKLTENLNKAVTDGQITQKMADWMVAQAKQNLPNQLSNTGLRGMHGEFKGGEHPGTWGEPPATPETQGEGGL